MGSKILSCVPASQSLPGCEGQQLFPQTLPNSSPHQMSPSLPHWPGRGEGCEVAAPPWVVLSCWRWGADREHLSGCHGLYLGKNWLLSWALPPFRCAGMYRGLMVAVVPRDVAVEESRVCRAWESSASGSGPVEFYLCCQGWLFWEWRLVVNHRCNLAFPALS